VRTGLPQQGYCEGDVGKLPFQPVLHSPHQRQRSDLAGALPGDDGLAADGRVDCVEARQCAAKPRPQDEPRKRRSIRCWC
jgi:hypothetical protein